MKDVEGNGPDQIYTLGKAPVGRHSRRFSFSLKPSSSIDAVITTAAWRISIAPNPKTPKPQVSVVLDL
jgi:hypothetical protein